MTQPAPNQQGHTGQVVAAAVVGLALIAIETRVRQDTEDTINNLYKGLAAAAILTTATVGGTTLTGLALIALPAFHRATTALFDTARLTTRGTTTAGYNAASQAAYSHARDELGDDNLPDTMPPLGDALDVILHDIDTMFGHAQADFQNIVAVRYDPQHRMKILDDIAAASAGLRNRAQAAAGVAVHQGANDALQALYAEYQQQTGQRLLKRWRVTASDPCGMCDALNGTVVAVSAEFDHNATTHDKDLRRVWRNLQGPPRHPNCRCQLELVIT